MLGNLEANNWKFLRQKQAVNVLGLFIENARYFRRYLKQRNHAVVVGQYWSFYLNTQRQTTLIMENVQS